MHDAGGATESLHEAALDSLPVSLAVLDDDGTIVETNEAWDRFGRDNDLRTDTVGANYFEACEGTDDEYAARATEGLRSLLDGERERFEMEYPCHSPREKRWFVLRASSFSDAGDRYAALVHNDVTERKLAELEVREQAAQLDEKRRNVTMLNRVVRHDIRNEMSVVLTWAKMLTDHVDEEGVEGLEYILDAGEQVVELTRTAGDLAELLAEDADLPLEPVELAPVLRSEMETLRAKNAARNSDVTVTGDSEIPEVTVLADRMLSSVFVNLLNNAVLHNDGDATVSVSVTVHEETVVVRIADDGPGIPDDRKESVFGRGERGIDSGGTGLGLYLVDRTVSRYGGDVRIEDNEPKGAVFRVELPRA